MKTKELSQLMEWAVWAHLDSQKNIELVLLKGHMMLEVMVNHPQRITLNAQKNSHFSAY